MQTELPPFVSAAWPAMLDEAPVGVLVEDAQGRVLWANRTLADQVGAAAGSLVGAEAAALPLKRIAAGAGAEVLFEVVRGEGEPYRCLACSTWPSNGRSSEQGLRVRFFVDAVRRRLPRTGDSPLLQLLRQRPGTDPASGVLDRRSVTQVLQSEVSRSRRYGNVLSVVLLEVPGGALDGERMARAGRALKEQTRWADSIGRWSEERFLLVLPETPEEAALLLVDKLQAGQDPSVPALRCGIAQWRPGDDLSFLVARTEAALSAPPHRAPRESRNHG